METTAEYIKLADIDVKSAEALFDNLIYSTCVQHCAQAAEKYLKAFVFDSGDLSYRNINAFPRCG